MAQGNRWWRMWQHIISPTWRVKQHFPEVSLRRLEGFIARSEARHMGQIRFVIESNLTPEQIWHRIGTRERAWAWFGELKVWDTEHNSGVLVYISFADHAIEVVCDRGVARQVDAAVWQAVCREMEQLFQEEAYIVGLETGLRQIDAILCQADPRGAEVYVDELSNEILVR